jgi:hypothetical protein
VSVPSFVADDRVWARAAGAKAVAIQLPLSEGPSFEGVVDLLTMQVVTWVGPPGASGKRHEVTLQRASLSEEVHGGLRRARRD